MTDAAMIALAAGAATLTHYSCPLAIAAIRFIVYLVLSVSLLDAAGLHLGFAALSLGLGAVWNVDPRDADMAAADRGGSISCADADRGAASYALAANAADLDRMAIPVTAERRVGRGQRGSACVADASFVWVMLTFGLLPQRLLEPVPTRRSSARSAHWQGSAQHGRCSPGSHRTPCWRG